MLGLEGPSEERNIEHARSGENLPFKAIGFLSKLVSTCGVFVDLTGKIRFLGSICWNVLVRTFLPLPFLFDRRSTSGTCISFTSYPEFLTSDHAALKSSDYHQGRLRGDNVINCPRTVQDDLWASPARPFDRTQRNGHIERARYKRGEIAFDIR